ncbi:Pyruvate kinase PKM [Schistosoma japonicum]|uniref:Pyruvate kinase n=2 Tax=Schistosoma japonicum TaxID=6182 RepID=A0A4Z2DHI7_SCHJA|nr:Pyruvate kinase PKM [Schistosoma japonicum]
MEVDAPSDGYFTQYQQQQHLVHAHSLMQHISNQSIDHAPFFVRHTNLVCTLGDHWDSDEKIDQMIKSGMNILRLNLSMGTKEKYAEVIRRVRRLEESYDYNPSVGIALDLSAPPVRTGLINESVDAVVVIQTGQMVTLTINDEYEKNTTSSIIWINSLYFPHILHTVGTGDRIYIGEGIISLIVRDVGMDNIKCLVEQGGEVGSYERVQLPSERMYQATFNNTYKNDLNFAVQCQVDYVFTGYTTNANQVAQAKNILGKDILLFAKIETKDSVKNLDEIMLYSDGIIIGRGGLSLCYPNEKIFQLQKQIIAKCNIFHKPVFVITQLLESMRFKPRATRAEISDVANAVLDGADGLILTTCREAESAIFHERFWIDLKMAREVRGLSPWNPGYFACLAAVEASTTSNASAIFVVTTSGRSALDIASFHPACPVVAIMRRPEIARKCHSTRGIHPFVYTGEKLSEWSDDMDERLNAALNFAKKRGFIGDGDQIIVVTGQEAGSGSTNTVRIFEVPPKDRSLAVVKSQSSLTS